MKPKKNFLVGFFMGIAGPLLIISMIYGVQFANHSVAVFLQIAIEQKIMSAILALSIVVNLGIFYLFLQLNREWSGRGVMLATLLWGMAVIYFKFIQ